MSTSKLVQNWKKAAAVSIQNHTADVKGVLFFHFQVSTSKPSHPGACQQLYTNCMIAIAMKWQ